MPAAPTDCHVTSAASAPEDLDSSSAFAFARRRWILVLLVAQALMLLLAWTVSFREIRSGVASRIQDQVFAANADSIASAAPALADVAAGAVVHESEDWERSQDLIERLELAANGFACIVDREGFLLCHPEMRADPSLRSVSVGDVAFRGDTGPVPIRELRGTNVVHGRVTFFGVDRHLLSSADIPGTDLRILVHQPESSLISAGEAATSGLGWVAVLSGLSVLVLTGVITSIMAGRHDARIAQINAGLEHEVARRVEQATRFRDAIITGLAKLADQRDTDTGAHLDRIASYSEVLARGLAGQCPEIDESYIRRLRTASAMHDIGKVGICDDVLLKPGPLTPDERRAMEKHPLLGADTLMAIRREVGDDELVEMSIIITLQHHERWDGTGYPFGLPAERIDLAARIVAVADVYDALTSDRVYKAAMSHEKAVEIIGAGAGTQFDPMVVEAMLEHQQQFDEIRNAVWGSRDDERGGEAFGRIGGGASPPAAAA